MKSRKSFTDPKLLKAQQVIDNLKDKFRNAAEADTGAAQPLFQNLSDQFSTIVDKAADLTLSGVEPGTEEMIQALTADIVEFGETANMLDTIARGDDGRVTAAYFGLMDEVKSATNGVLSSFECLKTAKAGTHKRKLGRTSAGAKVSPPRR